MRKLIINKLTGGIKKGNSADALYCLQYSTQSIVLPDDKLIILDYSVGEYKTF